MNASPPLTLHCFAGDAQSLPIILLADYLSLKLNVRYLKPINLNEKLYKSSLTKTFPMLQIDLKEGVLFIEKSNAILRHLARLSPSDSINHSLDPFKVSLIDQLLDTLNQEIFPVAQALFASNTAILELDKTESAELKKQLFSNLNAFGKSLKMIEEFGVTLADFMILGLVVSLNSDFGLNRKIPAFGGLVDRLGKASKMDPKFERIVKAFKCVSK